MRFVRAALAVVFALAFAASAFGLGDLLENAIGFSFLESTGTVLLWILLGGIASIPFAAGAAALLVVLPRRSESGLVALVAWAAVQGAILAGARASWFGVPVALAASTLLLVPAAWLARQSDPWTAVRGRAPFATLALVLLSALVGALRPGYPEETQVSVTTPVPGGNRGPNVVLVVLDTLRADHLGAYGDPRGLSPGFDALAREGTLFEDAFANAPWTVPSHASLFTGLPPRAHGASTLHHRWLDDRFTTLAEALRARGYRTAMFSANRYLDAANLAQGFDLVRPIGERFETLWIRPAVEALGFPAKWADHGSADGVEAVDDWLGRTGADGRSRFVFVNLLEPHWRYLPPLSDRAAFLPDDVGLAEATLVSTRIYGPLLMAGRKVGGPVDVVLRAMYAAAVRYQDRRLAKLVAVLDERLGASNTILVITADHGENLGEGGRYDHVFAVNDHLTHVPLLVRYPGVFPAGERIGGLCDLTDVPSTILGLVPAATEGQEGATLAEGASRRSLAPGRFEARPFVVAEGDPYFGHLERMASAAGFQRDVAAFTQPLLAIRTAEWKLVLRGGGAPSLYDVRADPDEIHDLLESGAGEVDELSRALEAWRGSIEAYCAETGGGSGSPLSPEARERLRRLGYTGRDD